MASPEPNSEPKTVWDGEFATTHWSVILAAGESTSPQSQQALEQLCRAYWYPLYAYVRRRGYGAQDAQDLTQEFFARLLAKKYFGRADPERGRFRSFLLASLKNFLANEWEKARTAKRGGARAIISWDEQGAESSYLKEPADETSPETIYEKRWAATLLEQVLARVREDYAAAGNAALFEGLKEFLWGARNTISYAELAGQLGLTEGAVKVAVHRLRHRYRDCLLAEIANTVSQPGEIDEELRYLKAVVSG